MRLAPLAGFRPHRTSRDRRQEHDSTVRPRCAELLRSAAMRVALVCLYAGPGCSSPDAASPPDASQDGSPNGASRSTSSDAGTGNTQPTRGAEGGVSIGTLTDAQDGTNPHGGTDAASMDASHDTATLPNLVSNCNGFNASDWVETGGSAGTGPGFSGTLVADPSGDVDAQQVSFTDPRSGFFQIISPPLAPNTTYTASIFTKLISGTPNLYLGYYNGESPITQYSPKIASTSSWQRTAGFTFTTGASDTAPSIAVVNANVDGASQGNDGTVAVWGLVVESGPAETAFTGCAGASPPPAPDAGNKPPPAGRQWALFVYDNGSDWTSLNDQVWSQPIDGEGNYSDIGDSYIAGATDPTPTRLEYTIQYGTPGSPSFVGGYVDMGQAANGAYNATWLSWLEADAAAVVAPVWVVRIWQEINGNWFQWSVNQTGATSIDGTPNGSPWPAATIIAAWNNMAAQVRTAFPDALIEWNLSAGGPWSGPTSPGNGTGVDLYPGNTYVDIIGLDSYEQSETFSEAMSGSGVNMNTVVALATTNHKRVSWSESATSGCDGSYLTSVAPFFDGLGTMGTYYAYFDGNNTSTSNILWTTSGQPGACAANTIQAALNASSFGTKPFNGTWYPR
jgi:hypothetical protein